MIEAIILGIIQGLTEFIPVSSSGHLLLAPKILGWDEQSTSFDIVLHGGTLLALIIFYNFKLLPKKKDSITTTAKEWTKIFLGILPAAIIGGLFEDQIDKTFKSALFAAFMLITIGVTMIYADYFVSKQTKLKKELSFRNAGIIGLLHPLAYIRGTSRSGITILAGVFQKIELKTAVNFSFIIGIPLIGGAFLLDVYDLIQNGGSGENTAHLLIGFIAAFISGLIAINFMLNTIEKTGLKWFGLYRILLGILVIILL